MKFRKMKIVYKRSVIIVRIRIHHVANQWIDLEIDEMKDQLFVVQILGKEEIPELEIVHVRQGIDPDLLDVMLGIEIGKNLLHGYSEFES